MAQGVHSESFGAYSSLLRLFSEGTLNLGWNGDGHSRLLLNGIVTRYARSQPSGILEPLHEKDCVRGDAIIRPDDPVISFKAHRSACPQSGCLEALIRNLCVRYQMHSLGVLCREL